MHLTPYRKLTAIQQKYYSGQPWEPKLGDHYTIVRADLELFQITGRTTTSSDGCPTENCKGLWWGFYEKPCPYCGNEVKDVPAWSITQVNLPDGTTSGEIVFAIDGFAEEGFGSNRVHVPSWIFEMDHDPWSPGGESAAEAQPQG